MYNLRSCNSPTATELRPINILKTWRRAQNLLPPADTSVISSFARHVAFIAHPTPVVGDPEKPLQEVSLPLRKAYLQTSPDGTEMSYPEFSWITAARVVLDITESDICQLAHDKQTVRG